MTMRVYTAHHIRYRAGRVQAWAFYAGALAGLVFIGCAIAGSEAAAMAVALIGSVALGISIGAWLVAERFK